MASPGDKTIQCKQDCVSCLICEKEQLCCHCARTGYHGCVTWPRGMKRNKRGRSETTAGSGGKMSDMIPNYACHECGKDIIHHDLGDARKILHLELEKQNLQTALKNLIYQIECDCMEDVYGKTGAGWAFVDDVAVAKRALDSSQRITAKDEK